MTFAAEIEARISGRGSMSAELALARCLPALVKGGHPSGLFLSAAPRCVLFTEKQITLLKTFADQAVIAIENVRLFKELQERNAELREALEHQTATWRRCSVSSAAHQQMCNRSLTLCASAARVCGIEYLTLRLCEGNMSVPRAHLRFDTHRAGRGQY